MVDEIYEYMERESSCLSAIPSEIDFAIIIINLKILLVFLVHCR